MPAASEMTGDESGSKLNTNMVIFPYFRISDSAFSNLWRPISLSIIPLLNDLPIR